MICVKEKKNDYSIEKKIYPTLSILLARSLSLRSSEERCVGNWIIVQRRIFIGSRDGEKKMERKSQVHDSLIIVCLTGR